MTNESLRSFFKHFTNLNPSQRMEFERIVNDVEGTLNTSSLQTSLQQLRRNPNFNLPFPQPTAQATVRGAIVEWPPLADPNISFYEIDVADQVNFASFETTPTIGASFVIDGITTTKFVRVRGVRKGGETTPYSETITINPILFDIRVHSLEAFYLPVETGTTIGGANTDLEYTPTNPQGQSLVYGFVNLYGDPETGLTGKGEIVLSLFSQIFDANGVELEPATEVFRITASEYFGCHALGPATVKHGPLNSRIRITVTATDATPTPGETNTKIEWIHLNTFELGTA